MNYKELQQSLNQGNHFLDLQKDYLGIVGKKRLNLIEKTSSNHLGYLEGMENQNPINSENDNLTNNLMDLENKFNQTLNEYTAAYKQYLNEVSQQDNQDIMKYKNSYIMSPEGRFYYVNKYGIARGFTPDAWSNKPDSCPPGGPSDDTKKVFHMFKTGLNYEPGQPCNLDGSIIRNKSNGRAAWISEEGERHWYPNSDIFEARIKNGCPKDYTYVSNEIYNMYPKGKDMNADSKCSTSNMNTPLWNRIIQLNQKLMNIANEMYQGVERMNKKGNTLDSHVDETKTQLISEIQNLNSERVKLEQVKQNVDTLDGEFQNKEVMYRSSYYHYLVWLIGAITLGVITIHHITKK